jgi:hypothetical protein
MPETMCYCRPLPHAANWHRDHARYRVGQTTLALACRPHSSRALSSSAHSLKALGRELACLQSFLYASQPILCGLIRITVDGNRIAG